ncbi:DMT family transporter [Rhodobacteraceae bacterium N5(2021)]|uniref:DMT family transporter n=1 Tax=Gymnodinialimonas phycosphaerae TaxID=2841589 RepID=A0A975TUC6_9RHOB|nr:DMT family transporter [Gymnodinialimonas phycosphaerae]MBY4895063.1 DMT family transporter [Gymnodinialimonas phycosphaerae]
MTAQPPIPATPAQPGLAAPAPGIAIAFMLCATAFIAATTLLAKALGTDTLGPPLHPVHVSHGRFLFAWITIACVIAALRPCLTRPNWGLHIGRTLTGFGGVTCMFAAAALIPLADATAITFLNPVFGMILAIPLLGERVGKWRWLAAAIAFAGALVLIRPGAGAIAPGAFLALAAALAFGLELTFIKRLAGRERPLQILFVNNSLGVLIATAAVIAVWQPPTVAQWAALAALGTLMAAAQACFVNAVARADASLVTPFSYLTLVFAALYDFAVFGVTPTGLSLLGATIIIAGAALLAWREARAKAPSIAPPDVNRS